DALSQSSVKPLECLVVDDGSTDDSKAVAARHGARVMVLEERQGPARARNIGARHAQGDLILFLDADVCIHDDALGRVVEHFSQDLSLDAVIGAYDDKPAAKPFVSRHRNLLHCFTHRAGHQDASTFWSGCGAVRRETFLRLDGFDEHYDRPAIEDIEFGARLKRAGGRIRLDAAIQVQHLKCWTFMNMLKTDIFDRGIPWTRLILRTRSMPDDLNVRWSQRLSVALAFLLAVAIWRANVMAIAGCGLALGCLNVRYYFFLAERNGGWFALRAVPLHFLFHFYSGVAFLLGAALHVKTLTNPWSSEIPGEEIP
ncbi:MAG TPA: glycosyltransferase family 2 protein, partial [Bryobacteraceae bacterium]|nr:glycosyltransferase family 2 protein [Bryobacteraceae bacterium]